MAKVCHLVWEHPPFDGRIFYKESSALVGAGHVVNVLGPSMDGGRTFGRAKSAEIPEEGLERAGIRFHTYPFDTKLPRDLGIRKRWNRRSMRRGLEAIAPDVVHVHEDNITLDVALEYAEAHPEKKLVYDMHEHFMLRRRGGKPRELLRYLELEDRAMARADLVVGVSTLICDYAETLGARRTALVHNAQSKERMRAAGELPDKPGAFVVVHEGRVVFDRGIREMVEIAREVRDERIVFLLIGPFLDAERAFFEQAVEEHGLEDRFVLTGLVDYDDVGRWLSVADVGLYFSLSRNLKSTIAHKFFNYLRFGLPIVSTPRLTTDAYFERYGCGKLVDVSEPAEVARLIETLANDDALRERYAAGSRRAFREELNWETSATRLVRGYEEMLAD